MTQRTFVMLKPDAVGRRLCGRITKRFEAKGLKLVGLKMQVMSPALAEQHYAEHRDKPFFDDLVGFITSGPTVQMVWEGKNAIEIVRKLVGATHCAKAECGTIRGDFGMTRRNLVHASDCPDSAQREIGLFFREDELIDYPLPDEQWVCAAE